jgi:hypothetical protein
MNAASIAFAPAVPSSRRHGGRFLIALAWTCCSLAPAGTAQLESWPLPGRNVVPGDATLFLEFSGAVDTICDISISGRTVASPGRGHCRLVTPLPERDCFIYVERVEGRGDACVMQDPRGANGYKAVIRVRDAGAGRGNYILRAHYSGQSPEKATFSNIIRIPDALQPHYTPDGQFRAPAAPQPLPRGRYSMPGRFWGEQPGPVRALIDPNATPVFRWRGRIGQYAVLAFNGAQIKRLDCGLPGAQTLDQELHEHTGSMQDSYLVLSECTAPGRVRVIQPGSAGGAQDTYLIEIDNRETKTASVHYLTGHLIRKEVIDRWHRPDLSCSAAWEQATAAELSGKMSRAAECWIAVAARAGDEDARLWALEKFCLRQPYPGPAPNPQEEKMLNILQNQALQGNPQLSDPTPRAPPERLLEVLLGRNVILAWPKDYVARVPTKWRFLAELDAGLEWLKIWTGNDQVRRRGMRMIARFRVDDGGTALYTGFRVHIPRREMTIPPDHYSYAHEVSHGFVSFPALTPTGRFAEGLTEVSRAGYWRFLGLHEASTAFQQRCLILLTQQMYAGRSVLDASSYAEAASLYFVLMDRFCRTPAGTLDWLKLSDMFALADVNVPAKAGAAERWQLLAHLSEKAFGPEARSVLAALGVPLSGQGGF